MNCFKECKRCHKPFPDPKYFENEDASRCITCDKIYEKEKQNRTQLNSLGLSSCMKGGFSLTLPLIERIIDQRQKFNMSDAQAPVVSASGSSAPSSASETEPLPEADVVLNYQKACAEETAKSVTTSGKKRKRLSKKERDQRLLARTGENPLVQQIENASANSSKPRKKGSNESKAPMKQKSIKDVFSSMNAETNPGQDISEQEDIEFIIEEGEQQAAGTHPEREPSPLCEGEGEKKKKKNATPRKRKQDKTDECTSSNKTSRKNAGAHATATIERRRVPTSQRLSACEEEELRISLRTEFCRSMFNYCVLPMIQDLLK